MPSPLPASDTSKSLADLQRPAFWEEPGPRKRRRGDPSIRVLIVADGYRFLGLPFGLDFSRGAAGLCSFAACLLDRAAPARFEVSLAHLDQRSGSEMMDFDPRIRDRMPRFAFDDPAQFHPERYDVLFLFGCVEKLARDDSDGQLRLAANGEPYPLDRLAETEIAALTAFQQGGGGLFATGDTGRSGSFLGQHLPRASQMRRWTGGQGETRRGSGEPGANVVALHPLTHPPLYLADPRPQGGRATPFLPANDDPLAGAVPPPGPDFPAATDGGPPPLPERVRAGPPGATGLSAYDGHRAGIGRTLTAATWRPFVNSALEDIAPRSAVQPGGAPDVDRGTGARCRALALWLTRPGMIDRLMP